MKKISFVIPLYNEEKSLRQLYKEIIVVIKKLKLNYEIIFVNDGSRDQSQRVIEEISKKDSNVVGIEFFTQSGKAAALQAGFNQVSGDIVFTLDSDLQDDPQEIPKFIKKMQGGYDVVSGWKFERKDSFIKNNTSKIFNFFTSLISKVNLHDFNCGFKAYRTEVVKHINLYGELHRYIPILVAQKGFRVGEIRVVHRKRKHGDSKYKFDRFIKGALDLLTVFFITKYKTRPLHLFGYFGMTFFLVGFLMGSYLIGIKILYNQSIGNRPLLLLSVMLMIMGIQIGVTGLVGEQIVSRLHRREDIDNLIKKVVRND